MSDSTNNTVNGHIMSLQPLISPPLVATIDADAMSTERYMKHFMSLAFESYNPADGSTGCLLYTSILSSRGRLSICGNSLWVALLTALRGTLLSYGAALASARSGLGRVARGAIDGIAVVTNTCLLYTSRPRRFFPGPPGAQRMAGRNSA